jgi:chitinase
MRRPVQLVTGLAAGIVAAAAFVFVVPPALAATNTITNPGFESGLAGWSCTSVSSAVTGHAHSGTMSLAGGANNSDNAQCTQKITVAPSTAYTLSAFVNGSYVFLGVTGTGTGDPSNWTPGTNGAYQQLSVNFTTGSGVTSVTVYVHGWYGQGTYYADDFSMPGPGGGPSPTPSTGSPSPTKSPSPSPSPSKSPSPSPSPSGSSTPPTGSLPKHELTGYWQNFNNGAATLRLRDVSSDYDLIAVAFADTDPSKPGGVVFNVDSGLSSALGGYTNADLKADINTLHSRGKRVVISVGGQNGTVSVGDSTSANNFASSVFTLMQSFGFDGVDVDLENGLTPDAMSTALHSLRNKAGSNLIVTLAPETLFMQSASATYLSLALKIKDVLTVVHTQYYNSGSMNGCDGNVYSQGTVDFITAQACIALQAGLRPDQVALGFPASGQAAGSGFVSTSVVNAAVDCLTKGTSCGQFHPSQTWPGLRGVMTWSVNWDKSSGNAFSSSVKAHLKTLP